MNSTSGAERAARFDLAASNVEARSGARGASRWAAPIGGALIASLVDLACRPHLPEIARALLPALAFAGGAIVAGRRISRDRRVEDAGAATNPRPIAESPEAPATDQPDAAEAPPTDSRWDGRPATSLVPGLARACNDLDHYHVFTDILSGQMANVTELTDEAARAMLANLTRIDEQIAALLQFIQQSGSNAQVSQIVAQIGSQMRDCQELLKRFVAKQQSGAVGGQQKISRILSETQGVMGLLESVDGIARQTRMLSFNVAIEAARAGEFGQGFAVIGSEIRNLSSEVSDLSKEVRERLESLMRTITIDLRNDSDQRERDERDAVGTIEKTLEALSDDLMTLITHQRDILAKVESENESIARPVMEAMGSIQFQDIIRQQLEQLVAMARMVGEHMRTLAAILLDPTDDGEDRTLSDKLDELYGAYVMERQRATHLTARGEKVTEKAAAKIELF
jgi:hypothetical protein